jgi:hypothetical protein
MAGHQPITAANSDAFRTPSVAQPAREKMLVELFSTFMLRRKGMDVQRLLWFEDIGTETEPEYQRLLDQCARTRR